MSLRDTSDARIFRTREAARKAAQEVSPDNWTVRQYGDGYIVQARSEQGWVGTLSIHGYIEPLELTITIKRE